MKAAGISQIRRRCSLAFGCTAVIVAMKLNTLGECNSSTRWITDLKCRTLNLTKQFVVLLSRLNIFPADSSKETALFYDGNPF